MLSMLVGEAGVEPATECVMSFAVCAIRYLGRLVTFSGLYLPLVDYLVGSK